MGSRGWPLFDLNELPAEDGEEGHGILHFQPLETGPSTSSHTPDLLGAQTTSKGVINNHAHPSSVSGFQPFAQPETVQEPAVIAEKISEDQSQNLTSSKSSGIERIEASSVLVSAETQVVEREEGEWSDAEASIDAYATSDINFHDRASQGQGNSQVMDCSGSGVAVDNSSSGARISGTSRAVNDSPASLCLDSGPSSQRGMSSQNFEGSTKREMFVDGREEPSLVSRQKEGKGAELSHALRSMNSLGRKPKIDEQKEVMLGKKRGRQTRFLDLEDAKQASSMKTPTAKRQNFPTPVTKRIVKEARSAPPPAERHGEKLGQSIIKDLKQPDASSDKGGVAIETGVLKSECNGDVHSGHPTKHRRQNAESDFSADMPPQPIARPGSWKHPADLRHMKSSQVPNRKSPHSSQNSMDLKAGNKKHIPTDTKVERLIREVISEKLWHRSDESELQCVPGQFESVDEYVSVFEPLLFEECRAQLYGTWEELCETPLRDSHVMVRVKNIDRRDRGWYDVIVLPVHECKWTFKEGDLAVLSSPWPGSARTRRNNSSSIEGDEEPEISGRVAGTVRRYIPLDSRDPKGAIIHFYVGDLYDPNSKADDHILRKLQPRGVWYLTVLGSLATTQREYRALHAFRQFDQQIQNAILQPSPEHFPVYGQQSPAMPECFTQNFVDHLHRSFNGPQLEAIQWAALHTAAGTSGGLTKKQIPWPFTLVQGPPGTGKTHTVWGMLNVIHLVQYQHYYTTLLKSLAPESYKQANESNSGSAATGSIDGVLQNMDKNLFRTLPKLCPKPRMLVCAPSNAATDELLARVLDRGFIDGEMKVYRPDVARVGVDSQTRAAQAVSVERRTDQLLNKNRDEIGGWMYRLRGLESQYSHEIGTIQRELNNAALAIRSQGSVGVDPDVLVARDQNRDAFLQRLAEVVEQRDKVLVEMSRLIIVEGKFRNGFNLEEARASLEASFANEAEIVFTTVSSSGRKLFSRLTHGFDMVVIDEAAQASEMAVLPPLSLHAARCVLVGDPQQLPATVISKAAGTLLYSRSLFERFQQAGCPTLLLSVQYRMHPQIRDFPSRYFYQGRVSDSESVAKLPDEAYYKDPLLRPYLFYDVIHGRESHRGGSVSYQNVHEAQFCLRLYEHLQKTLKSLGLGKVSVGIITPYKLQLKCIQREFGDVLKSDEGKDLYINTVDAFQGQERDVIIMSCVRASNHGVGFVADIRRMNVALTRARRALWVMGHANALMNSDDWAALIADARARTCYVDMDSLPKDFLAHKSAPYSSVPGRISSNNMRGFRPAGPRRRPFDMHTQARPRTPAEDDDNAGTSITSRNGNYSNFKQATEYSFESVDQFGQESRDASQYGVQKKQNTDGLVGKRDS